MNDPDPEPRDAPAAGSGGPPEADLPAWFGKVATLGDFAHRRLPAPVRATCDAWLSRAMRQAEARLGSHWLPLYLTAPLLRFAWAPGVVDPRWWFGVLMPSCDDVGRYFPLLVASSRTTPPVEGAALAQLERWYGHLARAATSTLQGASIDTFEAALRAAPAWPQPAAESASASTPLPIDGVADLATLLARGGPLPRGAPLERWLAALAARGLHDALQGRTVWWRAADEAHAPHLEIVEGLPEDERFVDLLDPDH